MSKPKSRSERFDEDEALNARLLEYRRENFAVEVAPSRYSPYPGEVALSVTQNGHQWSTIGLLPEEIDRVIEALSKFKP